MNEKHRGGARPNSGPAPNDKTVAAALATIERRLRKSGLTQEQDRELRRLAALAAVTPLDIQ